LLLGWQDVVAISSGHRSTVSKQDQLSRANPILKQVQQPGGTFYYSGLWQNTKTRLSTSKNNMTKIFLTAIAIFVVDSCTSQNTLNCSKFKNGTFKYSSAQTGNIYTIERNDSLQIERNLKTGSVTTLKIKWTGQCEYELTLLNRQSSPLDTLTKFQQKIVLKTKILKIGKNYCIFSSQAAGVEGIMIDTLKL
jgi:hypothetical protein